MVVGVEQSAVTPRVERLPVPGVPGREVDYHLFLDGQRVGLGPAESVPGLPDQLVGFVAEHLGVAPAHAEDPTVFADEPDPLSIL